MDFECGLSKRGLKTLSESGGAYTNTGSARVICSREGEKMTAIYIPSKGTLSCGIHAIIPITKGCVVIDLHQHRGHFECTIYSITSIFSKDGIFFVSTKKISEFEIDTDGIMDGEYHPKYENAIKAAISKAKDYHCRKPYYIRNKKNDV